MAQPTQNELHTNQVLTDLSIKFMRAQTDFIGERVFPIIPVAHKADSFNQYNRNDWYREAAELRAPGTESAGSGWTTSQNTYNADPYAIHKDVTDPERANADSVWNMDVDASEFVATQLRSKYENLVLTEIFRASTWTGAATGNDQTGVAGAPAADQFRQWDDVASTPFEDLRDYITQMHQQTGVRPNTLVLGPRVADVFRDHPDAQERIKYTQKVGNQTFDLLGEILDLNVMEARYTRVTTAESATTDTYAYQAGTSAWLGYVERAPGLKKPSAGYSFSWTGLNGTGGIEGLGTGVRMKKFRMEAIESDRVEGQFAVDVNVVSAILGIRFSTVVSA